MTSPATAAADPQQLLQAAEQAFAAGELRRGYYLIWDATMAALRPFAARMACPCETSEQAWAFIRDLDGSDEYWHRETYPYYF